MCSQKTLKLPDSLNHVITQINKSVKRNSYKINNLSTAKLYCSQLYTTKKLPNSFPQINKL